MGDCYLEGIQIGDDGRDASGRMDLPECLPPTSTDDGLMDRVLEIIEAECGAEAERAYRERDARRQHQIETQADLFARQPWRLESLDRNGTLARWDAPERIIQVCTAMLNDPGADEIRLRGAIRYAEREMAGEKAA